MLNIITDSSSEFTEAEAKEFGIRIVPLTVIFDGKAYLEGVDLNKDEFYKKLTEGEFPHTSQPSTEQLKRRSRR